MPNINSKLKDALNKWHSAYGRQAAVQPLSNYSDPKFIGSLCTSKQIPSKKLPGRVGSVNSRYYLISLPINLIYSARTCYQLSPCPCSTINRFIISLGDWLVLFYPPKKDSLIKKSSTVRNGETVLIGKDFVEITTLNKTNFVKP